MNGRPSKEWQLINGVNSKYMVLAGTLAPLPLQGLSLLETPKLPCCQSLLQRVAFVLASTTTDSDCYPPAHSATAYTTKSRLQCAVNSTVLIFVTSDSDHLTCSLRRPIRPVVQALVHAHALISDQHHLPNQHGSATCDQQ